MIYFPFFSVLHILPCKIYKRLRNIFVTLSPKVTKNEKRKMARTKHCIWPKFPRKIYFSFLVKTASKHNTPVVQKISIMKNQALFELNWLCWLGGRQSQDLKRILMGLYTFQHHFCQNQYTFSPPFFICTILSTTSVIN